MWVKCSVTRSLRPGGRIGARCGCRHDAAGGAAAWEAQSAAARGLRTGAARAAHIRVRACAAIVTARAARARAAAAPGRVHAMRCTQQWQHTAAARALGQRRPERWAGGGRSRSSAQSPAEAATGALPESPPPARALCGGRPAMQGGPGARNGRGAAGDSRRHRAGGAPARSLESQRNPPPLGGGGRGGGAYRCLRTVRSARARRRPAAPAASRHLPCGAYDAGRGSGRRSPRSARGPCCAGSRAERGRSRRGWRWPMAACRRRACTSVALTARGHLPALAMPRPRGAGEEAAWQATAA